MFGKYKRAEIKFLEEHKGDALYPYALYDDLISVGDTVVVKTGHHGFALAEVTNISEDGLGAINHGREIISYVDFRAYNSRREKEKRLNMIEQIVLEKARNTQFMTTFEMLAEKDTAVAELLAEYKNILDEQWAEKTCTT